MLNMDNIRESIEISRKALLTKEKTAIEALHRKLDITPLEREIYARKNTLARASEKITQEASQYIYYSLMRWEKITTEERITLTLIFVKLLY